MLTAPATSQGELSIYHLATSKPMLYVSPTNPAEVELRATIEETAISAPTALDFEYMTPKKLVAEPARALDRIQAESFVVIDPVDPLEREEYDQYLSFINSLKSRLRETDSVGVVYCLDTDPLPDSRRLRLKCADYIWQLEQIVLSRDINTRLLITKARRGRALSEPIPLVISDHVWVDTSRRIS